MADRVHRTSHHHHHHYHHYGHPRATRPVRSRAPCHLRRCRLCRHAYAHVRVRWRARAAYGRCIAERRLWERRRADVGERMCARGNGRRGTCAVRARRRPLTLEGGSSSGACTRARCWDGTCQPRKILLESRNNDAVEIVASDFHPLALENLRLNIENNNFGPDSSLTVSAHFLDWQEAADPENALEAPFDVMFDEVFGADVVYEVEHAAWISACLRRLVHPTGRFHLVIPVREGFARESAAIERLFPHVHLAASMEPTLCITQKESIICEAGLDNATGNRGDVEYAHYTIQWADRFT